MWRILIPIIGLLCVMYACTNDLTTIGQEVIGNDSYIGEESFPVTYTATIKADSFITSTGQYATNYIDQLVMGRYKDEHSGTTIATPCFQIAPEYVPEMPDNAVLDSVTFNFTYAGNMWGDTLYNINLQTFHLHQLKEVPVLNDDDNTFFYNTKTVDTASIIGSTTFYPQVENMNLAYFKIDQALGDTLFKRMIYHSSKDDDIYNPEISDNIPFYNFIHYFKGLAIVADPTNDCLMTIHALSDSLYLEFHYSISGEEYSLKFPLAQRDLQYNRIINEPIPALTTLKDPKKEVLFSDTVRSFTQGMCGYMIKFTLPNAPGFDKYMTIIKAQLELKPEFINYSPIANPQIIAVYTTNDINKLDDLLYNNSKTPVVGTLVENETDTDKTRYIFDMTEYYQKQSASPPTTEKQQVLLSVPNDGYSNTGISFDQMILREVPVLTVYYAKYK